MIEASAAGGWSGRPEAVVRTADGVERFIDVLPERPQKLEMLVVEIIDLFADVGEDLRGLERKVDAVRRQMPAYRVHGLLVVRATNRNRALIAELTSLIAARFTSGERWIEAMKTSASVPAGDGFLWSASHSAEPHAARLVRPGSPPSRRWRPQGTAGSGR